MYSSQDASKQTLLHRKKVTKNEKVDFSLTIYNVLADYHIFKSQNSVNLSGIYSYCDKEYLLKNADRNSPRHLMFMEEMQYLASDVFCLQEVGIEYLPVLKAELQDLGYESHFEQKVLGTPEGVMTSYKRDVFQPVSEYRIVLNDLMYERISSMQTACNENQIKLFERDSVALVLHMKHILSNKDIIVCNYHAIYDVANPDIATLQICLLAQKLNHIRKQCQNDVSCDIPIIFCGDFNAEPDKYAYKVVVDGKLSEDEVNHLAKICYEINPSTKSTTEKLRVSDFPVAATVFKDEFFIPINFESSYKDILGLEPELTSSDGLHVGTFDYIFHTEQIETVGVLSPFSKIEYLPGGPSRTFPSDHTSLKAEFRFLN